MEKDLKLEIQTSIATCDSMITGIREAIENNATATSTIEELEERIKLFEFIKQTLLNAEKLIN